MTVPVRIWQSFGMVLTYSAETEYNMKTSAWLFASAIIASTIAITSCQKEVNGSTDPGSTRLKINMTDAPTLADSVNVDIQQVRVNFSNDTVEWVDLTTHAGVYDLLGLQNGVDTLLATGTVPTDTVRQIRFVLGTNNSITVAGVTYPLTIPSGAESGLKINVDKHLNGTLDSLLIDFDAALSIHQTGNGTYVLRPVLRVK
jgi:hypothetical protein